jgi:hypothetical protein
LVARMLSLGVALGWSVVAAVGLSPWSAGHAASPVGSAYANHPRRPHFRPWYRVRPQAPVGQWRPQPTASVRALAPARVSRARVGPQRPTAANALLAVGHEGHRKAKPIARGQGMGVKFRPAARATAGEPLLTRRNGDANRQQVRLHAPFRPARAKRRPTYEQLQAQTTTYRRRAGAGVSYASSAVPLRTAHLGYWSVWPR